jgi:hypothetical protein
MILRICVGLTMTAMTDMREPHRGQAMTSKGERRGPAQPGGS